MHIMTENGWRPLVDFSAFWQPKVDALNAAIAELNEAKQLPTCVNTDREERSTNNHRLIQAYQKVCNCRDRMLGAE